VELEFSFFLSLFSSSLRFLFRFTLFQQSSFFKYGLQLVIFFPNGVREKQSSSTLKSDLFLLKQHE